MKFLPILAPIVFFVAFAALALFIFLYQRRKERERTQQMQMAAGLLGWQFAENVPLDFIAGLESFALFSQGHSKQIKNMMYGEASGIKAAVFDYVYVTGSGKHRATHYQSVVYLEPRNLSIPFFSLRPENLLHKLFTVFGYQDIDFGQRPGFSQSYILRGHDELAIRQTFNDRLLSFYENYPGTCTDGGGNQLLLFRSSHRFQQQEIQNYVGLALNLLQHLPRY